MVHSSFPCPGPFPFPGMHSMSIVQRRRRIQNVAYALDEAVGWPGNCKFAIVLNDKLSCKDNQLSEKSQRGGLNTSKRILYTPVLLEFFILPLEEDIVPE